MKIQKTVLIKEVASARDKLVARLEKMKDRGLSEKDEEAYENLQQLYEADLEYFIDEINDTFDFDGEEE